MNTRTQKEIRLPNVHFSVLRCHLDTRLSYSSESRNESIRHSTADSTQHQAVCCESAVCASLCEWVIACYVMLWYGMLRYDMSYSSMLYYVTLCYITECCLSDVWYHKNHCTVVAGTIAATHDCCKVRWKYAYHAIFIRRMLRHDWCSLFHWLVFNFNAECRTSHDQIRSHHITSYEINRERAKSTSIVHLIMHATHYCIAAEAIVNILSQICRRVLTLYRMTAENRP